MAFNWEPKFQRFKRDKSIYIGGSTSNNIGGNQYYIYRGLSSKASKCPYSPGIELGSHSHDTCFDFGFKPREVEIDPIPNINIPSDIDAWLDGTLTPVSVALDDVHLASQDEIFPITTPLEHNIQPLCNSVGLDSPAFSELTNPHPTFVYVLDRPRSPQHSYPPTHRMLLKPSTLRLKLMRHACASGALRSIPITLSIGYNKCTAQTMAWTHI